MDDKEKLNIESQAEPYEKKKCSDADIQIELLKQVLALRKQVNELKEEILKLQMQNEANSETELEDEEDDDGIEDDDYDEDVREISEENKRKRLNIRKKGQKPRKLTIVSLRENFGG